jgi:hypothetical protein
MNKRFKPKIGKTFYVIWIPTVLFLSVMTAVSLVAPLAFVILLLTDALTLYFLLTSLFGYVELRDDAVFVKFGFIAKAEIPYSTIRGVTKERKLYADSIMSLKNSLDHVNIKYNRFDIVSVSVTDNDELISEIEARIKK